MTLFPSRRIPAFPSLATEGPQELAGFFAAIAIALSPPSLAQCISRWSEQFAGQHTLLNGRIREMALFDPDHGSPQQPSIFAAGEFTKAGFTHLGGVARRNGIFWEPLGDGLDGPAYTLLAAFESTGAFQRGLYVGGAFASAGSTTARNIARWDGQSWQALGSGLPNAVTALARFDADGAGPSAALLMAGSSAGISRWDGASWTTDSIAATNGPTKVLALVAFDEDAEGPAGIRLFAGGHFAQIDGVQATNIARWDATSWSAMSSGLGHVDALMEEVRTLVVHDDDGDGPVPAFLAAGGVFYSYPIRQLARWDGAQWVSLNASVFIDACSRLRSLDLDAEGPQTPILFAATTGLPEFNLYERLGSQWMPVESTRPLSPILDMMMDTQEDLRRPLLTLGGGNSSTNYGLFTQLIDEEWNSPWIDTGRFTTPVTALAPFDADGAGPSPISLCAGTRRLHTWDSQDWSISDFEFRSSIRTMEIVDFDAAGPSPPRLAICASNEVALWDGTTLRQLPPLSGLVMAIKMFDSDGDGPAPPLMHAATTELVMAYDPLEDNWDLKGFTHDIRDMAVYDRDGAGPLAPRLFVSSGSTTFNGGSYFTGHIARYDGLNWSAAGSTDLAGPAERLLVGPDMTNPEGSLALYTFAPYTGGADPQSVWLLRWAPPNWVPVGSTACGSANTAIPFDMDADGINDTIIRATDRAVERLDHGVFVPFADPAILDAPGRALAVTPAGQFGSLRPSLFVGGEFFGIGGLASRHFAHWHASPPEIRRSPADRFASEGRSVRLVVESSGVEPLIYQWRKEGAPLLDDDRIAGSTTRELTISALGALDAGEYDVTITDDCGQTTSAPGQLMVTSADCTGDIDGDGTVGLQDLANLLARFGETGAGLGNEDIDIDDDIDLGDLVLLLGRFGGVCP